MPSSTRPHPVSIDRNKVLESAQKFLAKGQFDKAIVEYQKLTAADPKDVRTLLKIAELQAKKGSLRESVDTYLKVGDSYAGQGFFSKSIAVYKQAVRLDATRLDALKKLAQNYEELQHTADALTAYDMLAQAHQSQGQTDGALAAMRRATEIDQQNLAARIRYAEALSRAGKTTDAAEEFEKGALIIKAQGRMDDYIKVAERLLFHRENDLEVARELAGLYLERNDGKRALGKLQMLFKANPKDEGVLGMLAQAFIELDQKDKAVQVLKELAKNHLDASRPHEREQALRKILELDPTDVEAKHALTGTGRAPRPRVNIDDVVPAAAVIGGGGLRGAAGGATARGTDRASGRPPGPAGGTYGHNVANRAPAPSVPRPGVTSAAPLQSNLAPARPAATANAAQPPRVPPPTPNSRVQAPSTATPFDEVEFEADSESDELIIVEDDAPSLDVAPEALAPAAVAPRVATAAAAAVDAVDVTVPEPPAFVDEEPVLDAASREAVIGRMLAECDVFARYGLRARIIEQLEKVVELAPDHRIARERLRDAYLEEGRIDDAVEELVSLAEMTRATDPSFAIAMLEQALSYDDENPDVKRALRALTPALAPQQAELIGEDEVLVLDDPQPDPSFEDDAVMFVQDTSSPALVPPSEPELYRAEPEPVGRPATPEPAAPEPAAPAGPTTASGLPAVLADFGDFDDFDDLNQDVGAVATPVPVAHAAHTAAPIVPITAEVELDLDRPMSPEEFERAPLSATQVPTAAVSKSGNAIEEVLDEADFYLAQELFDEARETLEDALAATPNHPLLRDKLEDVEELELEAKRAASAAAASAPVASPKPTAPAPAKTAAAPKQAASPAAPAFPSKAANTGIPLVAPRPVAEMPDDDDDAFALAERLAEALEEELGPGGGTSPGADTIDVDQVFAQFKRGIEQQIDESDCETHYDLGIAYKEMGLLEDAVSEFEIAAKNLAKSSVALTMIGLCRVEQGQVAEGVLALERALQAPHRDAREELGLWYELGIALSVASRNAEAIAYFERVKVAEPGFRGVSERIAQLKASLATPDDTSEQDELERAFDELITG